VTRQGACAVRARAGIEITSRGEFQRPPVRPVVGTVHVSGHDHSGFDGSAVVEPVQVRHQQPVNMVDPSGHEPYIGGVSEHCSQSAVDEARDGVNDGSAEARECPGADTEPEDRNETLRMLFEFNEGVGTYAAGVQIAAGGCALGAMSVGLCRSPSSVVQVPVLQEWSATSLICSLLPMPVSSKRPTPIVVWRLRR